MPARPRYDFTCGTIALEAWRVKILDIQPWTKLLPIFEVVVCQGRKSRELPIIVPSAFGARIIFALIEKMETEKEFYRTLQF